MLQGCVAVRDEVVVQFWLKPGEAAVTLGVGEEREVEQGNRIKNRNYLKIFVFKYLHFLAGNVFESNQP